MPFDRRVPGGIGVTVRQTVLWAGVLAVLPLLTYPRTFGLDPFNLHPGYVLIEWGLYLALFFLTLPALTLSQRLLASGFTVVYRLVCAGLFASLAALNSDLGWSDTVAVAMWSYPLAVVPQMILAPVATTAVWKAIFAERPSHTRVAGFSRYPARPRRQWVPAAIGTVPSAARPQSVPPQSASPTALRTESSPSFDDAVAYLGDYNGVRICWLVDSEGLTLAFWQRRDYTDALEFWAPISVEIVEFDRRCLSAEGDVNPQRVEVRTDSGRLIIESVEGYWLGVLTDQDADELIGVRLSQARDMIHKHLQERCNSYAGLQEARYV